MSVPRLPPCPDSPNCVSSLATDDSHRVEPFELDVDPDDAWRTAEAVVRALPRTEIVSLTDRSLRAVCTTALLRFRDDLALELDRENRRIDVRSASRVGYSDLGANRRRVEALRRALRERGVVR